MHFNVQLSELSPLRSLNQLSRVLQIIQQGFPASNQIRHVDFSAAVVVAQSFNELLDAAKMQNRGSDYDVYQHTDKIPLYAAMARTLYNLRLSRIE